VDTLSDPAKRRDYDARLRQEEAASAMGRHRSGPSAAAGRAPPAAATHPPFSDGDAFMPSGEIELPCRSCGRSHTCSITTLNP